MTPTLCSQSTGTKRGWQNCSRNTSFSSLNLCMHCVPMERSYNAFTSLSQQEMLSSVAFRVSAGVPATLNELKSTKCDGLSQWLLPAETSWQQHLHLQHIPAHPTCCRWSVCKHCYTAPTYIDAWGCMRVCTCMGVHPRVYVRVHVLCVCTCMCVCMCLCTNRCTRVTHNTVWVQFESLLKCLTCFNSSFHTQKSMAFANICFHCRKCIAHSQTRRLHTQMLTTKNRTLHAQLLNLPNMGSSLIASSQS